MAMALSIHTKQKNLKLLVNASPVEQLIVWGVEGRHFTFGLTGRTGWTSWRRSEGFTNLEFEIGYKF